MQFKPPKNTERYYWTSHAIWKMKYYGLSAQRILRVINNPQRKEEGIAENTVAVMQPASINKKSAKGGSQPKADQPLAGATISGGKTWSMEIWAMYQLVNAQCKIISAWRYPGVSPKRNFIPAEIAAEVKDLI